MAESGILQEQTAMKRKNRGAIALLVGVAIYFCFSGLLLLLILLQESRSRYVPRNAPTQSWLLSHGLWWTLTGSLLLCSIRDIAQRRRHVDLILATFFVSSALIDFEMYKRCVWAKNTNFASFAEWFTVSLTLGGLFLWWSRRVREENYWLRTHGPPYKP